MDIEGFKDLPKLFISPIEQVMDAFKGLVKEFLGLFKISEENISLVQLIHCTNKSVSQRKTNLKVQTANATYLVLTSLKMNRLPTGFQERKETIEQSSYPTQQKDL